MAARLFWAFVSCSRIYYAHCSPMQDRRAPFFLFLFVNCKGLSRNSCVVQHQEGSKRSGVNSRRRLVVYTSSSPARVIMAAVLVGGRSPLNHIANVPRRPRQDLHVVGFCKVPQQQVDDDARLDFFSDAVPSRLVDHTYCHMYDVGCGVVGPTFHR